MDRGNQMRAVSSKIPFLLLAVANVIRNFIYETKIIISEYVVLQSMFIDIETDDLE